MANPALARMLGYESPEGLIGAITDMRSQLFADPHQYDAFCRSIEDTGNISGFECQVYRRDKSPIWISIKACCVRDLNGKSLYYDGMVEDIGERKRAQEALLVSYRLLEIAGRQTEMTPLLKEFVTEIKTLTTCSAVGIRILDEAGNIPYAAYEGFSREFYELENPLSIHSDQCMCIDVIKGSTDSELPFFTEYGSFYINDSSRFLSTVSEKDKGQTRNTCNHFGYESVALIPIRQGERIIGLIHIADPDENRAPLWKVEMIEKVAMELGAAVQRVQAEDALRESERQLRHLSARLLSAHEEERKRIAGELHDSIGASLGAIKYSIEQTRVQMLEGKATPKTLEKLVSMTQQAIAEARRMMSDLRPSMIDDLGILPTIRWFTRQFQETYKHIRIEKTIEADEDNIPDSIKIVIFRILQESLHNIAKYSKADLVKVSLLKMNDSIELTIEDNGVGFDVYAVSRRRDSRGGLGLTSMRERAELSGGDFSIKSIIRSGTTIRASWPNQSTS
jgi:PAS domain S-box-containing protein